MKALGILSAFLVVISISFSSVAAEKGYKKILGVWDFSAPSAPQPYDSGTLTFKEVDKKLTGGFTVQGQEIAIPKVEFGSETLTLNFEVENTPINLILKLKEGVLEGSTETPNGLVTVTAKPSRKTTK
jgi:hypothetical protein